MLFFCMNKASTVQSMPEKSVHEELSIHGTLFIFLLRLITPFISRPKNQDLSLRFL